MDIHPHKLQRVEENARRLGIDIIETECMDARAAGEKYPGQVDGVLVDAPCSGLGVLRRKPDSRWRKKPEDLVKLPKLQLAILRSAAEAVKPGGTLVYSTCTLTSEENGQVVEAFLKERGEFHLEGTGDFLPTLQLYPQRDGTDGFFIARMRKNG